MTLLHDKRHAYLNLTVQNGEKIYTFIFFQYCYSCINEKENIQSDLFCSANILIKITSQFINKHSRNLKTSTKYVYISIN